MAGFELDPHRVYFTFERKLAYLDIKVLFLFMHHHLHQSQSLLNVLLLHHLHHLLDLLDLLDLLLTSEHPGVGFGNPLLGNGFEDEVLPVKIVDIIGVVHSHDKIVEVQEYLRQVLAYTLWVQGGFGVLVLLGGVAFQELTPRVYVEHYVAD
jgi:hypothetical protein